MTIWVFTLYVPAVGLRACLTSERFAVQSRASQIAQCCKWFASMS